MVEIFKTNVHHKIEAEMLLKQLSHKHPALAVNFDLEDCDKILRLAGNKIDFSSVIEIVTQNGYICEYIEE